MFETTTPDLTAVIRAVLKTEGTALHNLIGDRVWSPSLPSINVWNNELPAIVFLAPRERIEDGLIDANVIFRCYGGSRVHDDARTVYRFLHELLKDKQQTTDTENMHGLMMAVHESTAPDRNEPDTGYPVVISNYHCLVT